MIAYVRHGFSPATFSSPLLLVLLVDSDHGYVAWASSVSDFNGDVYFDKFANSQQEVIPEASTLALLIIGGACLLRRPRRRKRT